METNKEEQVSIGKTVDTSSDVGMKPIDEKEYKEFLEYKKRQNASNIAKGIGIQSEDNVKREETMSINKKITQEIESTKRKSEQEQKILEKANMINEVNNLAKQFLSKHFDKDTLLAKGFTLDEIMTAQKKELVKKYVPSDQIKAIARVDDIEYLEGELLEQLVSLAKVNINDYKARSMGKQNPMNAISNSKVIGPSITDPNFYPTSFEELKEGILNRFQQRIREKYYSTS